MSLKQNITYYSFSEIDTFLRCERKHNYSYVLGLESKQTPAALARGSVVHACVAAFWSGEDILGPLAGWEPDNEEELDKVRWLMARYARHYETEQKSTTIVATEFELMVRLGESKFGIRGFIDRLIVQQGKLWLVETKTMGDFSRLDNLSIDPQLSMYYLAAKQLGLDVWGAYYDAIYTYRWVKDRPTAESFKQVHLDRDRRQSDAMTEEVIEMCRRIESRKRRPPTRTIVTYGPMACSNCSFNAPCFENSAGYLDEEQAVLAESYQPKERR